MKKKKVLIFNYGAGNTTALQFALERLEAEVLISDELSAIDHSDCMIIPGVGAAGNAMEAIESLDASKSLIEYQKPVLGICLGMQLLCDFSEEGQVKTLGVFPDQISRIESKRKVPHLGWNKVHFEKDPIFNDINPESYFYFVHSYYLKDSEFAIANTAYDTSFVSVIRKNNFYACQFHPEKSGNTGQQFLQNFLKL